MKNSEGKKFRDAITAERPLHVIGVADGSDALAAEKAGFKAIYLSGSQMAASRGWADIGKLELKHVVEAVERIKDSGVKLPLLVDIDTGFNDISETISALETIGVAAVHIEDQEDLKMCGHLDGKHVISKEDATKRIENAVAAKKDSDFVIMARTDALAVETMQLTLERIESYCKAGADMIFAEAFPDNATYAQVKLATGGKPVLANMTDFGKVDLLTPSQLKEASNGAVDIMLTPLSVYRAERQTASMCYNQIRNLGTQKELIDDGVLQNRTDFKNLINYDEQVNNRAIEIEHG